MSHSPSLYRQHVKSSSQFTRHQLDDLTHLSLAFEALDKDGHRFTELSGKVMTPLFFENSSRTYSSFVAAHQKLGGSVVTLDLKQSSLGKGESLADTIRTMDSYSDVLVLRHPSQEAFDEATAAAVHPILNAGNGVGEHPTQALLDVVTMRAELNRASLDNITVVLVGDLKHGRTVHSLAKMLTLYRNVTVICVAPQALQMPEDVVSYVQGRNGAKCEASTTLSTDIVSRADVVYVTRVQKERFASEEEYRAVAGAYVVNAKTLASGAKPAGQMIVMHPLPRNDELATDVDSDPRAAYFRQMRYGLYARMALLTRVLVKPETVDLAVRNAMTASRNRFNNNAGSERPSLATTALDRAFRTPFLNAAGVYCMSAGELDQVRAAPGAGGCVTKSCTLNQRDGNPSPRYAPFGDGSKNSVNSMGLPNQGFEYYHNYVLNLKNAASSSVQQFFSVSGMTREENIQMAKALAEPGSGAVATGKTIMELNLSCPNVPGKSQIGYDFECMTALLKDVCDVHPFPFGVKMPPYFDMAHFDAVASILNGFPLVAFITSINSLGNGLVIDVDRETVLIKPKEGFGGLGGTLALPTALANVRAFAQRCPSKTIVGCGGVTTGEDAFCHILAGASLVMVGTQLHEEGPSAFDRIGRELQEVLVRQGYSSVEEARGKLKVIQ